MQAPFSPDTVFRQSNRISSGSTIRKDGSLHRKSGSHRWQSVVADRYSQPARRYSCFGRVVQFTVIYILYFEYLSFHILCTDRCKTGHPISDFCKNYFFYGCFHNVSGIRSSLKKSIKKTVCSNGKYFH